MKRFSIIFLVFAATAALLNVAAQAQLARQWVSRTSGNDKKGENVAVAVQADDSGYVYAAGRMENDPGGLDYATAKYDADGVRLWVKFYDNGSLADAASAMVIDTGGNIYVTGKSGSASSGSDFATIKYDNDGNQIWATRYNGPGNGDDGAVAIAVDESLNVYVSGWSAGIGSGSDFATVKYNSAGTEQWVQRYNGELNATDSITAMILDGFSSLFVTGLSQDSTNGGYMTMMYNPGTGDSVWGSRYTSTTGSSTPRAMIQRGGSLFVTGSSATDSSGTDFLTLAYDETDGTTDWESRFDSPDHVDDDAYALSAQGTSRLYVTGKSVLAGAFTDVLTIRYNQANGTSNWESFHNGPANDDDAGVVLTGGNNPLVVASSIGAGTGHDMKLIQYNGAGNEQWDIRYNGPTNQEDIPVALHDDGDALYVAGSSTKPKGKGTDFVVIKHVDPQDLKYRTVTQADLIGKGVNLKSVTAIPNFANVRDEAFRLAYPKIKKGLAGAPGGLVLGQVRPDSDEVFAWLRFTKGGNLSKFLPQAGPSGFFSLYGGKPFTGEKKNPKLAKLDMKVLGELVTLRINIGASDAEVTPPMLGDVTYDDGDSTNPYNGLTLREIAAIADNYLTYGSRYEPIDWVVLDTVMEKINEAFYGTLVSLSNVPLVTTGVLSIDSVAFLEAASAPILEPLNPLRNLQAAVPSEFALEQNYPNPFNPITTIEFSVQRDAVVTLRIYDLLGREAARLLDAEPVDEGNHEVDFDAAGFPSGVYYYTLSVDGESFRQSKRMLLIK